MDWTCEICGKDTSTIDYDYLDGRNHLACVLGIWGGDNAMNKSKGMKIKGWEKISGFTYRGYCIVNPIYNSSETKYMADILNLNLTHKPKWELSVLTPAHKFKGWKDNQFDIMLYNKENQSSRIRVEKKQISSLNGFRFIVEALIDQLSEAETKAELLSIINSNSMNTGIVNIVNQNGLTINHTSHSLTL